MRKIHQSYKFLFRIWRAFAFILMFIAVSSCDSFCGVVMKCGCIEADDFGEFEQDVLLVRANGADSTCEYDNGKPLTDASQGGGIKDCLTKETHQYTDNNGDGEFNSTTGCNGYTDDNGGISIQYRCISECIAKCQSNRLSQSSSAEPFWESTFKTFEVGPQHEIAINVTGSVNLSEDVSIGPAFVKPRLFHFHSRNLDSSVGDFEVSKGGEMILRFEGSWDDGIDSANNAIESLGGGTINASDERDRSVLARIHNGARRLVAYVQPFPSGYEADPLQTDEKLRTKGVPLEVDHKLWGCTYTGSDSLQANCSSDSYKSNGYPNIEDGVDLSRYNISALGRAPNLGQIGGIVRWDLDDVRGYDVSDSPFRAAGTNDLVECKVSPRNCQRSSGADFVDQNQKGVMIGKSLGGVAESSSNAHTYTNSSGKPVAISFINLSKYTSCSVDGAMEVKHFDSSNNEIRDTSINMRPGREWSIGESFFYLEDGDYLKMWGAENTATDGIEVTATDSSNSNSGRAIIKLNSGRSNSISTVYATASNPSNAVYNSATTTFVITGGNSNNYFEIDSDTGAIKLKAVVSGASVSTLDDDLVGDGDAINCAELYAYRIDPVKEITIEKSGMISFVMLGGSSATSSCKASIRIVNPDGDRRGFATGFEQDFFEYGVADEGRSLITYEMVVPAANALQTPDEVGSEEIFVRNGQVIRFNPRSWSGNWQHVAGQNRSCGIGMAMKIKPRLALLCRGREGEGVTDPNCKPTADGTACQAWAKECYDTNSVTHYCPTNTVGNENIDEAQQVNCQVTIGYDADKCDKDAAGNIPAISADTCKECAQKAASNASSSTPKMSLSLDQCYDLENYKGKVSNIPRANGFTNIHLNDNAISKGAIKLGKFDGHYGHLQDFSVEGVDPNSSLVSYRLNGYLPLVAAGKLKFVVLDGEDFNKQPMVGGNRPIGGHDSYLSNSEDSSYADGYGFKVNLSGSKEYFNGALLEVRLCKDTKTGDNFDQNCVGANPPEVTSQPHVVKVDSTTPLLGSDPNYVSYYKFDEYGRLVRFSNPNAAGEAPENVVDNPNTTRDESLDSNDVPIGTTYYVHSETDKPDHLRLSFKIKDVDVPNCNIGSPELNQDCTDGSCNGIKRLNNFYEKDDGNDDEMCTSAIGVNGCKKQFYCANIYSNNSGVYKVAVRTKLRKGTGVGGVKTDISNIVGNVVGPVVEIMDGSEEGVVPKKVGQAERVYKLIITDPTFKNITRIVFMLAIVFYGVGYLMGVSQFSQGEIMSRMVKIGIIYLFIGYNGWFWFDKIFVSFFKEGTDYLAFLMASSFDNSPEIQQALNNNNFYDKSILFASIDNVFSIFFSESAQKKIAALLFASIFGWAYLLIIYSGFLLYVYAVANAVLLYLTSQVFISILFVVSPLFFLFLFFKQTQEMFDKWLSSLISFSLQQIFLLTTLAFFNMMMYEILKLALGYRICWDDILVINTPIRITLLSFWTIATLPPRLNTQNPVGNVGFNSGLPSIFSILFIWVIASLMKQFITFMTDLAQSIGGGVRASGLSSGVTQTASKYSSKLKSAAKEAWVEHGGKAAVQRMDDYLFDSGKIADDRRKAQRAKNRLDQGNKSAMTKAGKDAVKAYKHKHGADATPDKLKEVRDQAMMQKAKARGLNEKQAKALMEDTGLKYTGDNVIGAGYQAMKQALSDGGSLRTSLKDKEVNSQFSKKDVSSAMKNLDKAGRDKLADAVKSGKIETTKSSSARYKAVRVGAAVVTGGTSEAAIRAARSVSKAVKKEAGKSRFSSGYNAAKEQLIKEGKVSKMRTWFGWARSETEQKLIKDRAKENKAKADVKIAKNSVGDIAKIMVAKDKIDNKEKNKEINQKIRSNLKERLPSYVKDLASNILNPKKFIQVVKDFNAESKRFNKEIGYKTNSEKISDKKQELSESGNTSHVQELHKQRFETVNAANKQDDLSEQKAQEAETLRGQGDMARMDQLQEKLDGASTKKEKSDIREQMTDLAQDDNYKQELAAYNEANDSAHAHANNSQNLRNKADKLGDMIQDAGGDRNARYEPPAAAANRDTANTQRVEPSKPSKNVVPPATRANATTPASASSDTTPVNDRGGSDDSGGSSEGGVVDSNDADDIAHGRRGEDAGEDLERDNERMYGKDEEDSFDSNGYDSDEDR